jgi:hypothetical protein
MAEQFCRLTPAELRAHYELGLLSAAAYFYYLVLALRKPGWYLRINHVGEFCQTWGIPRRSFTQAKCKLIRMGLLSEDAQGVKILSKILPTPLAENCPTLAKSCPTLAKSCPTLAKSCQATPLEPRAGAGSSDSPDSYRLDQIFSGETAESVSTNQADPSYLRFLGYKQRNPWKRLTGEGIERELVENPDPKIKFHWLKTVPSVLSPWWEIEFNPLAELPPGDPTSPESEPHLGNELEQSPAGIGGDS